jgi:hypothetical protein
MHSRRLDFREHHSDRAVIVVNSAVAGADEILDHQCLRRRPVAIVIGAARRAQSVPG